MSQMRFRMLQTRKTIKIYMEFLIIHYNRDLNANGHLLLSDIATSFWASPQERRKNDLLQKLLSLRSSASDMFWLSTSTNFPVVFKRFEQSGPPGASLATRNVLIWICPKTMYYVACLLEPDHIYSLYIYYLVYMGWFLKQVTPPYTFVLDI